MLGTTVVLGGYCMVRVMPCIRSTYMVIVEVILVNVAGGC